MTKEIRENFIVTADDYGIRQTAEPILRLAHEGKLDRVAVLIHYVSADQAKALLETGVKIDLHLELIDILKSGEKVKESPIYRGMNFMLRYFSGTVTAQNVEEEWRRQIIRFREIFGRMPDGLNSHEHLHFFPRFFKVFLGLAEEYGISYVRFSRKGMLLPFHSAFIGKILAFFWKRARSFMEGKIFHTSDYLVSLDWLADFPAFSAALPEGQIELVVHLEREEDYRIMLEHF